MMEWTLWNSQLDLGNDKDHLCDWISLTFLLLILFPVVADYHAQIWSDLSSEDAFKRINIF